jgi:hypothetical protein
LWSAWATYETLYENERERERERKEGTLEKEREEGPERLNENILLMSQVT